MAWPVASPHSVGLAPTSRRLYCYLFTYERTAHLCGLQCQETFSSFSIVGWAPYALSQKPMDALRLEGRHASKPQSPSQPSHPRLPRNVLFIGLFIITPILAIAAVLEVALAAEGAKRGPSTDSFSGASFFTEPKNISQVLSDYPVSLFAAQDSLKLATGSLSLICAVILGGMLWHASTKGPIKVRCAFLTASRAHVAVQI